MLRRIVRGLTTTIIIAVVGFFIRFALYHPAEARALFDKTLDSATGLMNKLPDMLKSYLPQEKTLDMLVPDNPATLETPQLYFSPDGLPVMLRPSEAQATFEAYAAIPTATPPTQWGDEVIQDVQSPNTSTQAMVEVLADSLRVRNGPGTDHEKIASVHKGERLAVIEKNETGDWVHIHSETGIDGWVSADYVQPLTENITAFAPLPTATSTPVPTPSNTPTPTATLSFEAVNPPDHGTSTPIPAVSTADAPPSATPTPVPPPQSPPSTCRRLHTA